MNAAIKNPWIPRPFCDWTHETARAAMLLVLSNTMRDNKDCKVILSHGGGLLPYVANRVANLSAGMMAGGKPAEVFLGEAKSFYFDLAFAAYDPLLELLQRIARPDHILFGSDYPFIYDATVQQQHGVLNAMSTEESPMESI